MSVEMRTHSLRAHQFKACSFECAVLMRTQAEMGSRIQAPPTQREKPTPSRFYSGIQPRTDQSLSPVLLQRLAA